MALQLRMLCSVLCAQHMSVCAFAQEWELAQADFFTFGV